MEGIDISYWQKDNYQTFINDNNLARDFVICRATFGRWVDPYCDTMYQYARAKGKKVGVYMFPLTSEGDAEQSAQWHYNQVRGYVGQALFALDWEAYNGSDGRLDDSNVAWALKWLQKFEQLSGVKPLIYMNQSCERSYNWSSVVKNNNGLWLANYGINDGADHGYQSPKYWPFVAIHQYTSMGNYGYSLDCDHFYGNEAAWAAYAGVKTTLPEPKQDEITTPTPKPSEEELNAPQNGSAEPTEGNESSSPTSSQDEKETPAVNSSDTSTSGSEGEQGQAVTIVVDTEDGPESFQAYIQKASDSIKVVEETAKKFGLKLQMSNKVYDFLKKVALILLPLSALYMGLASIWGWGFGEEVDQTVKLVISAVDAVLGVALVKSSSDYKQDQ